MMHQWIATTILAITFASAMGAQTLAGIVGEVRDARGARMPAGPRASMRQKQFALKDNFR